MSRVVEQPVATVQAKVAYNMEEAADALGVGSPYISSWVTTGELPAYRLLGQPVFLADDLIAFVRAQPAYTGYLGERS